MSAARVRGVLAIMGSGETSPTMVGVHRELMEAAGGEAAILDTSYAFQENAEEISSRAVEYFSTSVGRKVSVASLGVANAPAEERGLEQLRRASYLFAGPGSPSYALRRWRGTPVPGIFTERLREGATVVFASAAALTVGRWTIPVYEIYKAGLDPEWLEGIDLLSEVGLDNVAVVPHFDNREGGHHDTRFCYLGESRLRLMERQLGDAATVLGVDEHTVCVIDFGRNSISARGRGGVTLRRAGEDVRTISQTELDLGEFLAARMATGNGRIVSEPEAAPASEAGATPFMEQVDSLKGDFDRAIAGGQFDEAVRAVLALESEIVAWAADTLQSDEVDRARAVLRGLIQRLAEAGEERGLEAEDSDLRVDGLARALVGIRDDARRDSRFELSDRIRDLLGAAGIEVRDTPGGQEWSRIPLPTEEASTTTIQGRAGQ